MNSNNSTCSVCNKDLSKLKSQKQHILRCLKKSQPKSQPKMNSKLQQELFELKQEQEQNKIEYPACYYCICGYSSGNGRSIIRHEEKTGHEMMLYPYTQEQLDKYQQEQIIIKDTLNDIIEQIVLDQSQIIQQQIQQSQIKQVDKLSLDTINKENHFASCYIKYQQLLQEGYNQENKNIYSFSLLYNQLPQENISSFFSIYGQNSTYLLTYSNEIIKTSQLINKEIHYNQIDIIRTLKQLGLTFNHKTNKSTYSQLEIAIEIQNLNPYTETIIIELNRKQFNRYIICVSLQELAWFCQQEIQVNEVISSQISEYCYFYMDIDHLEEQQSDYLDVIQNIIQMVLQNYRNENEQYRLTITGNQSQSIHIYTNCVVYTNDLISIAKVILQICEKYLGIQIRKSIDTKPYPKQNQKRCLRLPQSGKYNEQGDFNCDKKFDIDFNLTRIMTHNNHSIQKSFVFNNQKHYQLKAFDEDYEQINLQNKHKLNQYHLELFQTIIQNPQYSTNYKNIIEYEGQCPICQRIHDSKYNRQLIVKITSKQIKYTCLYKPQVDNQWQQLDLQIVTDENIKATIQSNINNITYLNIKDKYLTYDGICQICEQEHQLNSQRRIHFNIAGNQIQYHCVMNPKQNKQFNILKQSRKQTKKQIKADTNIYELDLDLDSDQLNISREQLCNLNILHQNTIIQAGTGAGKTTMVIQNVNKLLKQNNKARILFLSCRISFSNSLHQKLKQNFPDIQIGNYKNLQPLQYSQYQILILQMECLSGLIKQINFKNYDMIVIDETKQCLVQLLSNRLESQQNLSALTKLVRNTQMICCLDALFTKDLCQIIERMQNNNNIFNNKQHNKKFIKYVCNYTEQKNATFYVGKNQDLKNQYVNHLLQLYKSGKCISGHISQIKMLQKISEILIQNGVNINDIIIIHGDDYLPIQFQGQQVYHIDQKDILFNDLELFKNYKIVLYTATMTVGCDFQNFDQFQDCISLLDINCCTVDQFVQSVGRFRNTKNQHIYIQKSNILNYNDSLQQTPVQNLYNKLNTCEFVQNLSKQFVDIYDEIQIWYETYKYSQQNFCIQTIKALMCKYGYDIIEQIVDEQQDSFEYVNEQQQQKCKITQEFEIYQIRDIIENKIEKTGIKIQNLKQKISTYLHIRRHLKYKYQNKDKITVNMIFNNQHLKDLDLPSYKPIKKFILQFGGYYDEQNYNSDLPQHTISQAKQFIQQFDQDEQSIFSLKNQLKLRDSDEINKELFRAYCYLTLNINGKSSIIKTDNDTNKQIKYLANQYLGMTNNRKIRNQLLEIGLMCDLKKSNKQNKFSNIRFEEHQFECKLE